VEKKVIKTEDLFTECIGKKFKDPTKAICCMGKDHKCLCNVNDGYCAADECQFQVFCRD